MGPYIVCIYIIVLYQFIRNFVIFADMRVQSQRCGEVDWCPPTSHHSLHSNRKSSKLCPFLSREHTPTRDQQLPDKADQIRHQAHAVGMC